MARRRPMLNDMKIRMIIWIKGRQSDLCLLLLYMPTLFNNGNHQLGIS